MNDFSVERQISSRSDLNWQFSMVFDSYNSHPAHEFFVASRWQNEDAAFQEYDFVPRDSKRR